MYSRSTQLFVHGVLQDLMNQLNSLNAKIKQIVNVKDGTKKKSKYQQWNVNVE